MALEAVVLQRSPFRHQPQPAGAWRFGFGFSDALEGAREPPLDVKKDGFFAGEPPAPAPPRRKRRRSKTVKNREEMENQRMIHIAVERNRRRQMNDHLAVLRSMMPPSYVQKGDQASVVGGAINFVKELEQVLQTLEASRKKAQPFSEFFSFPQYSEAAAGVADVEVTMVESHANVKVLSTRRPKQLLKMVAGMRSLRFTVLHLNVTTIHTMVLYSFSVKAEDDCVLTTVNEIAAAVHEMLGRIQEEEPSFGRPETRSSSPRFGHPCAVFQKPSVDEAC